MKSKSNLNEKIVLDHIISNKKPIILCKQFNVSKQVLSYYLGKLKKQGIIKKIDNGVWQVLKTLPKGTSKKKEIRGHAFIWKVRFAQEIKGWKNRVNKLNKLNIPFKLVGKDKSTPSIKIKGKKVWLTNNGLIIYEPQSFYDSTPVSVRIKAINELTNTIKQLESTLKVKFYNYQFSVKREHYALIDNKIAESFNQNNEKLFLIQDNEWWGVVDKSMNGNEFEFFKTKSNSGLTNSTGALKYYNSHKDTKWGVTPEYTLNLFNKLIIENTNLRKDLNYVAKNQVSHVKLIEKASNIMEKLDKKLSPVKKKKAYLNDFQSTLNNY